MDHQHLGYNLELPKNHDWFSTEELQPIDDKSGSPSPKKHNMLVIICPYHIILISKHIESSTALYSMFRNHHRFHSSFPLHFPIPPSQKAAPFATVQGLQLVPPSQSCTAPASQLRHATCSGVSSRPLPRRHRSWLACGRGAGEVITMVDLWSVDVDIDVYMMLI